MADEYEVSFRDDEYLFAHLVDSASVGGQAFDVVAFNHVSVVRLDVAAIANSPKHG
jgi:hypothetical protein